MKRKGLLILKPVAIVLLAVEASTLGRDDSVALRGDTERYTVTVDLDAARTGTRTAIIDVSARAGDPEPG